MIGIPMPRAHELLWLVMTASCLMSNPDDASHRHDGSGAVAPIRDEQALSEREVRAALWPRLRGTPYVAADAARVAATEALVAAAVAHALGQTDAARLPELAHAAGLVVERWRIDGRQYLALLEGAEVRGSTGAFVLRVGPPAQAGPERILQAPHVLHDVGTGELGLAMFLAAPGGFRGLFTNTLHRYAQPDGRKQKRAHNPSDVCHNDAHPFVAATMGAVRALGHAGMVEVVQLHGFREDHPDREQAELGAVVSDGDPEGGSVRVAAVADALRQALGTSVGRYPEDVDDLGGTTNVIGLRVRAEPSAGFLHLELSSTLRTELLRRPDGPLRLAAALGTGAPHPEATEAP
jgi:hypothetical protein